MDAIRAQGVIGGMFGDEGKGLITDALASQMISHHGSCVVARFNGGAQAGHTVQTPVGTRHVFHHLGSGSLAGASTFLGRHFVSNPMLFLRERELLVRHGANTRVFVDPRGVVSTPYDVMVNQAIERSRGSSRHGSCGIGFGETIERSLDTDFRITVQELGDSRKLEATLQRIRRQYLPARLLQLGLDPECMDPWRMHDGILDRFLDDAEAFFGLIEIKDPAQVLVGGVVLEGAQGLGLDEELGWFPHVTRSKTGLPWLLEMCEEARIWAVDVQYGTRAYTTRHGAGPMPHENDFIPPMFEDHTNQPNDFQGALRFSHLDVDGLVSLIKADLGRGDAGSIVVSMGGWVSCLDQMASITELASGTRVPTSELPEYLKKAMGGDWMHESWGAGREAVRLA